MSETLKDPVCGMTVHPDKDLSVSHNGAQWYFCSDFCKRAFLAEPEKYAGSAGSQHPPGDEVIRRIAYFSMEVGIDSAMATYSGGLGILAGDTLKSAADLRLPVVAVSLLNAKGYFDQKLDTWGNQQEGPAVWEPNRFARALPARVEVAIEGRPVKVRAWRYDIAGFTGFTVPLLLLDTNLEENSPSDRELTSWLYGGDERYRLAQEIILGIGGVRMLRALGYTGIERFHMNEGHAALLVVELLRERNHRGAAAWDFSTIRSESIFTTHTPVAAGRDQFSYDLVQGVMGEPLPLEVIRMLGGQDRLNMTYLALNMSKYVNGVARKHGEVSQELFPGYRIDYVTNGVHSRTWTADGFRELYDRFIPGWGNDPSCLRYAVSIPRPDIWQAHVQAKEGLLNEVNRRTGNALSPDVLTIGFARRATPYKRADLLFRDLGRLRDLAQAAGRIQFLFGGKAHPRDQGGKDLIRSVFAAAAQLRGQVEVVYLENYDMELARLLTAGVDLWLNTPLRPLEASGTSGMKAAHNGVPSFSVLDGWWLEGHVEGVTGWSIGSPAAAGGPEEINAQDAASLYDKLGRVILPLFYGGRDGWIDIMRQSVALNASFFNTHRMVQQYAASAYV
jgi:starch phosphorylase